MPALSLPEDRPDRPASTDTASDLEQGNHHIADRQIRSFF
jgi:hypothetical protein